MITFQLPDDSTKKTSEGINSIKNTIDILTSAVRQRLNYKSSDDEDQALLNNIYKAFLYLQNLLEEEDQKLEQLENEINRKVNHQETLEEILKTTVHPSKAYHNIINALFNITDATFKTLNEQTIEHIASNDILVDEQFIREFNETKEAIDCVYGYLLDFADNQLLLESADEEQQQGAVQYLKTIREIEQKLYNKAENLNDQLGSQEHQQELIKQANHYLKKLSKKDAKNVENQEINEEPTKNPSPKISLPSKTLNEERENLINDKWDRKKIDEEAKKVKIHQQQVKQMKERDNDKLRTAENQANAIYSQQCVEVHQKNSIEKLIEGRKKFNSVKDEMLLELLIILRNHTAINDEVNQDIEQLSLKLLSSSNNANDLTLFQYKYRFTRFMQRIVKTYYATAHIKDDDLDLANDKDSSFDITKLDVALSDLTSDTLEPLSPLSEHAHLNKIVNNQVISLREMMQKNSKNRTENKENKTDKQKNLPNHANDEDKEDPIGKSWQDELDELDAAKNSSQEQNSKEEDPALPTVAKLVDTEIHNASPKPEKAHVIEPLHLVHLAPKQATAIKPVNTEIHNVSPKPEKAHVIEPLHPAFFGQKRHHNNTGETKKGNKEKRTLTSKRRDEQQQVIRRCILESEKFNGAIQKALPELSKILAQENINNSNKVKNQIQNLSLEFLNVDNSAPVMEKEQFTDFLNIVANTYVNITASEYDEPESQLKPISNEMINVTELKQDLIEIGNDSLTASLSESPKGRYIDRVVNSIVLDLKEMDRKNVEIIYHSDTKENALKSDSNNIVSKNTSHPVPEMPTPTTDNYGTATEEPKDLLSILNTSGLSKINNLSTKSENLAAIQRAIQYTRYNNEDDLLREIIVLFQKIKATNEKRYQPYLEKEKQSILWKFWEHNVENRGNLKELTALKQAAVNICLYKIAKEGDIIEFQGQKGIQALLTKYAHTDGGLKAVINFNTTTFKLFEKGLTHSNFVLNKISKQKIRKPTETPKTTLGTR